MKRGIKLKIGIKIIGKKQLGHWADEAKIIKNNREEEKEENTIYWHLFEHKHT